MDNIGNNIRNRRRQLGIQQDQLAKEVGCTQAYISTIENGKCTQISMPLLIRISHALNWELKDILK
jgi:transcriptional regulator with XRE-family HTH domain